MVAIAAVTTRKALMVLTRCVTVDEFVATFRVFCDGTSLFVPTRVEREVGLEAPFAIQLANGTTVLSGVGVVLEVFATKHNVFQRPGLRLGLSRITPESAVVHARLRSVEKKKPSRAPTNRNTPSNGTPVLTIEDLVLFDQTAPIQISGKDGSVPLVDVTVPAGPTVTFASPSAPAPLDVPEEVIEPEEPAGPVARPAVASSHRRQLITVGALCALGGAALMFAVMNIAGRTEPAAAATRTAPAKVAAKPIPAPPPAPPATSVAALEPAPAPAPAVTAAPAPAARCTLSIATTPADAKITVDGTLLGTSPAMFVGDCGAVLVEVSRKRYETSTQTVTFEAGESQAVTIKLKRPTKRPVSAELGPSS